jgi:hypothetical protein
MKAHALSKLAPFEFKLVCKSCGNESRFLEVMAEEVHVVDGSLNYLHLLEAVTSHYICGECSERVKIKKFRK